MRFQVRQGTHRTALIVGNWVVKIPCLWNWKMFLQGLLANMQEKSWSGVSEKLCPVAFGVWGGFANVMPYARPVPTADWVVYDRGTFNKFRRHADGTFLPAEFKHDSVGYLPHPEGGEHLVIVDYGS